MPEPSYHQLSLRELARLIARRRVSPVEVIDATLERIDTLNPVFNCYLTVFEQARDAAAAAERRLSRKQKPGPLTGVPISLKDLIVTPEAPTTAGSRTFGEGLPPGADIPVARNLRRAGAIFVGKVTLHEIALGVTTVNEHFGPARNPWDLNRVAGGSSGGSAVAVAAELCQGSVGTDTRGSIRIPSACCGVTGLKPTYGLVPAAGVIPLSTSLDHVGPLTRSVDDLSLMLGAMTGSRTLSAAFERAVKSRPRLAIGVSDYHTRDLDPEVERALERAVRVFRKLGCRIEAVSLPGLADAQAASVVIGSAESFEFHEERLKQDPDGFGLKVRTRLEKGGLLTAVDLIRAERVRTRVMMEFARVFDEVDVLLGATIPCLPPRIEDDFVLIGGRKAELIDSMTRLNSPQNMAGVPALSLPSGFSTTGLPLALQLIAGPNREDLLLSLGAAYQRETDWHRRRPPSIA